MKNKLFLMLIYITVGCSNKFEIVRHEPSNGNYITTKELNGFKNHNFIKIVKVGNLKICNELKKIKKITTRENLMPSVILNYAFVSNKDTLYATYDLKFWYYKGKVQMHTSKIVNPETIGSFFSVNDDVPN